MQTYIAGDTTQKGKSLENLTVRILERLNYTNIIKNEISLGGHEIDVRAEFISSPIGQHKTTVICECKAHKKPLSTTDFFKFVGKVFYENLHNTEPVIGCLISLNGVNGHVYGQYRSLAEKEVMSLITGEQLCKHIVAVFNMVDSENIKENFFENTGKEISKLDTLIYEDSAFWLIFTSTGEVSLISSKGEPVTAEDAIPILNTIGDFIGSYSYLDVKEEIEYISKVESIAKNIMIESILSDRPVPIENEAFWNSLSEDAQRYLEKSMDADFESAVAFLLENELMEKVNETELGIKLSLEPEFIEHALDILRFIYKRTIPVRWIFSRKIDSYIDNDSFMNHVFLNTQRNLMPDDSQIKSIVNLMKISPSAFLNSIMPQPMLLNQNVPEDFREQRLNRTNVNWFISLLIASAKSDVRNNALGPFYVRILKLTSLEINDGIHFRSGETFGDFDITTSLIYEVVEIESGDRTGFGLALVPKTSQDEPEVLSEDSIENSDDIDTD